MKKTSYFDGLCCFSLVLGLFFSFLGFSLTADEQKTIQNFVEVRLEKRPKTTLQDIYKAFYQAEFGTEHSISDKDAVRKYFEEEVISIKKDSFNAPEEVLTEELSPDSSFVRVNLRPYIKKGCSLDRLFKAFLAASSKETNTKEQFKARMLFILKLASQKKIKISEIGDLDGQINGFLQESKPPAVSHSKVYKNEYHPSYRVVLETDAKNICN